jgi:lysozyme
MRGLLGRSLWLSLTVWAGNCAAQSNSVVNLSHYDELRPDFAAMRREGIVAAIHESTYPAATADAAYGIRQEEALRAGLLWGAYHFADATDPVRQADFFLSVVGRRWQQSAQSAGRPGVLLVLDFEINSHYPGGTMRVDQAVTFVERIRQRTGRYPGVYGGENRLASVLNNSAVPARARETLSKCWLWVANYHYPPRATAPWSHWTMWQYTGDGICDLPRSRYPTRLANMRTAERNFFRGGRGDVEAFWKANAWNPSR